MNGVGFRIKSLRKKLSLSQKEFSERIYVSQSYLSRVELERETPTPMLLKLISLEFNCTLEWLETGKGEMEAFSDKSFDYFDRNSFESIRLAAINECSQLMKSILNSSKDEPFYMQDIQFILSVINMFINENNNESVLLLSSISSYAAELVDVIDLIKKGHDIDKSINMLDNTSETISDELKQLFVGKLK